MVKAFAVTVWAALFAFATLGTPARAGTTGALRGFVLESASGRPIAGATITAASPSQVAQTVSDGAGRFVFIALAPDTYTVSAEKAGFDPVAEPAVTVIADQSKSVDLRTSKTIATIANTAARAAGNLVQPGVTSDVYSMNATVQKATASLAGADSLNQAYGAIASVPGVNFPSNQQGWDQTVYVRGGDYTNVAYELDGLPIVRQSDLAPIGMLSSLGSQEVQVYTGGTPATSNSSGLSGYINQVIKTGTYPGYVNVDLGSGAPAFYHSATVELAGATQNRLFSYYAGFSGSNQSFRYGDQFGGVADPLYFYPFSAPTANSAYPIVDGACAIGPHPTCAAPTYGFQSEPGYEYEQATNFDRENVVNLHFGIPHRGSTSRDDIQILYDAGGIFDQIFSSANDIGYSPARAASVGVRYPLPILDQYVYTGQLMKAPNAAAIVAEPYPSGQSSGNSPFTPGGTLGLNDRDGNVNDFSIEKIQYQKNFSDRSYVRAIGYGEYSDWLINGPNSAVIPFGATPPDQEYIGHTFGSNVIYANQVSSKNLLTAEGSYQTQRLQSYNAQSSSTGAQTDSLQPTGLGTILSSYGTPNGKCYNYLTGQRWSCFDAGSQGGCLGSSPCYPNGGPSGIDLTPGFAPAGSPAALAGATWMVTENGRAAQLNDVAPRFSSLAFTDVWQPDGRLTVNAGVRVDQFTYALPNLENGYPARQFWFDAYNNEHCGKLGAAPQYTFNGSGFNACAPGYVPFDDPGTGLYDNAAGVSRSEVLQPRVSFTYSLDAETVVRGSAGRYARAEGSNYFQENTVQQDLPAFLGQFYQYGYHTPDHGIQPDTSNNVDLSLEKHLRGTRLTFKLSPFYRATTNQLQYQNINPEEGIYAGVNVGRQQNYGVEFQVQYGDSARDGFSSAFSYTHTTSEIRFVPVNGVSVLQTFNDQIALYNSYTHACAGVTRKSPNWQACGSGAYAGNAASNLPYQPSSAADPATIPNPYFAGSLQPLFNPNGEYAPYDIIPGAFSGANGYEVPDVASLILNYRHRKFAVTPSFRFVDGSNYGAPLVYPGYVPQSCTAPPASTPQTPGATCNGTLPNGTVVGAIFLPDPYTGRFDRLGAFMQPSELSFNMQMTYDVSSHATLSVRAVNIVNACYQRGYPWSSSETCQYSDLPSQVLAPSGNFVANPPEQIKYPYGSYFNCSGAGYTAVLQPFSVFVTLEVRL